MKPNSTSMPPAARRIEGTRGVTVLVMRRPSMRACGRNSSARNRIIVGIANDAELQRPDHVRKFCWNAIESPMIIPPT